MSSVLLLMLAVVSANDVYLTGTGTVQWHDPTIWSVERVPGPGDTVFLLQDGGHQVVEVLQNVYVDSVHVSETGDNTIILRILEVCSSDVQMQFKVHCEFVGSEFHRM
jgi:hypothetical protein